MKFSTAWTLGGDFIVADADDEDTPLLTIQIHDRAMRQAAADATYDFADFLATMLRNTPHWVTVARNEKEN